MKLSELNDWFVLVANFGVLIGIFFLAIEIRQNTSVVERQISIERANTTHGDIANSDYFPDILTKLTNTGGESANGLVAQFMDEFDFTHQEAQRWWRYLARSWLHSQADWVYRGRNEFDCPDAANGIRFSDQRMFFEARKNLFEPGYIACVESKIEDLE